MIICQGVFKQHSEYAEVKGISAPEPTGDAR